LPALSNSKQRGIDPSGDALVLNTLHF